MNRDGRDVLVGTAAYGIASLFWGLNIPLSAALFRSFDPFWVSPCRYLIASLLLGAWVAIAHGPAALRAPIAGSRIAVLSLLVSCFLVLFSLGLFNTHPITAAAVIAGSPVYVAVVSRVWTGTPLERGFWGATLLTLIGAGIAIRGRADAAGQGASLQGGEILLVLSIACWTVYSVLAQRWFAPGTPQLRRTYLSAVWSIPWSFGFWALARLAGLVGEPNLHPDAAALTDLALSAVFCTALATVAWNTGVGRLGIAIGALWQNMVPVFAVGISLLFFGVVPTGPQVLGGAVVLAGVLYMQWHRMRAPRGSHA